ncbi:DUF1214 domain-containing protein [Sphingomonas cavernae]|uniref:DUF1214 domain-containing protein n=1 Tax=Sphingomonas cavernae TaxID=2320861 RepID=A0A418WPG1_9SPHN|nr:DUF1214 domain-containing protein [Sphingomonas cavernae]RJF93148.1 DUF1214 domain-containing protein [Sphingomonas cavernae]
MTENSMFTREMWRDFCRRLEAAGEVVLEPEAAATPLDRAEGFRYLTRLLRIGLEMHLEHADPDFPGFYAASHETAKIGADNPDNIYMNATVSPGRRYRITGKRGTVPILSFGTKANRYAIDGTMASTGELDSADMEVGTDGSFEIVVSKDEAEGNWLRLADDSSMVIVRQTFLDRANEVPASVEIEAIDGPSHPTPLTGERLEAALERVTAFVDGTARTFVHWAEDFRAGQFNALATVDQSRFFRAGGDPTIFYLHGWWQLAPGEALRIETRVPECTFWNFQLDNYWMESLDYRYHRIHVNGHSARLNDDGTLTLIIADHDPGYGNWIDTAGHDRGTMLLRWTGATDHPIPETKVIRIDG